MVQKMLNFSSWHCCLVSVSNSKHSAPKMDSRMKGETAQLIDSLKGTICNEIGKIVLASFQRCSISKNLETPPGKEAIKEAHQVLF